MADLVPTRRALLSVSDKTGLIELARALLAHQVRLLSTGGTARLLAAAGIPVREVADYTGFPEIMDGRVKTLHPLIHGALLGRRGVDEPVMAQHGIEPIDMLVVNLYPFAATIASPGCTREAAIEQIDVGGPAMLRAAAKNHASVLVVSDPSDYGEVVAELGRQGGSTGLALRERLASKAFAHTAAYDAMVAGWLAAREGRTDPPPLEDPLILQLPRISMLRYGENPQQQAAFYRSPAVRGACVATARLVQGRDLSFNNVADADTAIECVREFDEPACVIVKHANPCGVALAASALEAYDRAYRTDPTSAYGGIIAFNRELDARTADAIVDRQFVEVLAAPSLTDEARGRLAARPNVRVLELGDLAAPADNGLELRSVRGGVLAQTRDLGVLRAADLTTVTRRAPGKAELADLMFAWTVCRFVKSNAIVYASGRSTVGIGAGQMSRVYSSRLAAIKAADESLAVAGAVMASDAFFPFRDGIDVAAEHGIRAVIQPGGSRRDAEVIAAADEHGIAMVFTGVRHFRH